ncbi:MAG: dipeptidase [Anaerolineales bacterium]
MDRQNPIPIFDGHNDVLHKYHDSAPDSLNTFFEGSERNHLDYPRARQAGFGGGFFAVYAPNPDSVPDPKSRLKKGPDGYRVEIAPPLEFEYANQIAGEMIESLLRLEKESRGKLKIARTYSDLEESFQKGVLAAVMHIEGAEAVHPSLENLADYYQKGLRSIGITWSRENAFGHGVPFAIPASPDTGPGLTEAGKELVRASNRMGIMVDLAHLNEKGFWDAAEITQAPLVSSHTGAHALTPRTRNLTDEQLKAIAETRGLVGVTFSVNDLDGGRRPKNDAPPSAIIRHIRYIADRIGVDHVAFGSDLDGTTIPSKVGDVTGFNLLRDLLCQEGFQEDALRKICYQNWFRILKETWKD